MRSKWVEEDTMRCILTALTDENRLAVLVSLRHGLRIGDVLNLKTRDVMKGDFTIREQKTGKRKRVHLGRDLQNDLLAIGGEVFVFEGRLSRLRHGTRQAVFKDLRRVSTAFRLKGVPRTVHVRFTLSSDTEIVAICERCNDFVTIPMKR